MGQDQQRAGSGALFSLDGLSAGGEARRPAAKMIKQTCSPDARGQTAIGHPEASPADSYCAVQRTTLGQCAPPHPRLQMQGALFSRLKVLPEVRARGRVGREREIEEERGGIESLHKAHLSRVRQQGVPYGPYISGHTHP